LQDVRTVFIILMENRNWSNIKGSASAPYINNTLLPMASYARQYYTAPGVHPSLPNYLWLEAGTNFNITNDSDPSVNHQSTTSHLVTLLNNVGITWTSYQEDISGTVCPLTSVAKDAPKHNPMVYFDDVTNVNSPSSAYCIANVRPYTELTTDLQNNAVTRYNFITPNLCDDMHDSSGCATSDPIKNGDNWLAANVPTILNSLSYSNGGALLIVWDEGASSSDGPIGMIVISRLAKGGGYTNTVHYTHSSTLRTFQEIFNVTPFLRDAANATDLSDLFNPFPGVTNLSPACGGLAGGTTITITGSNFVNGATVTIGGQPASNVVFVSSTAIMAKTPAALAGTQSVVVKNPDTQTAALSNAFTYVAPPSFGGPTGVVAAVEGATLMWSAALGNGPMTYSVFQGTAPGGENFASPVLHVTGQPVFISSLNPGSTNAITYYFVCRAADACGNSESNNVEISIQPLLDPNKS
jgi:phosphatidylinositol-3-phosphatase